MCIHILQSSCQLLFTTLLFVPHFLACVYSCDLHSCLLPLVGHEGRWGNCHTGTMLLISKWASQQYCCWQTCHRGQISLSLSLSLSHKMNSYITHYISCWLQRQRMSLRHWKFIPYFWKHTVSYSVNQVAPNLHRCKQGKFCTELWDFHSCTMHLDTIEVFYLPTDAQ
jgi:hypothetical protein